MYYYPLNTLSQTPFDDGDFLSKRQAPFAMALPPFHSADLRTFSFPFPFPFLASSRLQ